MMQVIPQPKVIPPPPMEGADAGGAAPWWLILIVVLAGVLVVGHVWLLIQMNREAH